MSRLVPALALAIGLGGLAGSSAQAVPAPAGAPTMMPAKNYTCGWGMRTKSHSCDLARSLAWAYKESAGDYTRPKRLTGVYSPNSGHEYNFKCSGKNSVTCTGKGKVYLKWNQLPEADYCGDNAAGNSVFAWLAADCGFALATAQAYLDSPATYLPGVVDPADGLPYPMTCFTSIGTDMLCVNNAAVVVVRA